MQSQLVTCIDSNVKQAVEKVCASHGFKMDRFIEDALVDKLDELKDIEDLKKIRCEPSRPLEEVLKDLKLDGEL